MEPATYPQKVASEVRASIARAGVTAQDVANATGISKATLSRKLTGQTPFNTLELGRIGQFLSVDPASFLPSLAVAS